MSIYNAFWIAAAITIILAVYIAEKFIELDLSGLLPHNLRRAKLRRLLAERDTPLHGMKLHGDIKKEFEKLLIPLKRADKRLLPARMDKTFRRELERQLELLSRRGLSRDIRFADVVPLPKNDFRKWNDDGREWREAVLQCSVLDRLIAADGSAVHELYLKNARARLLQSRHVRSSDREDKKKSYYSDSGAVSCPSCGAEVELKTQQAICPYCGGILQSDFYDWQTEAFEIYEPVGEQTKRAALLAAASMTLFSCVFLCLWLIPDTEVSLTAGVGAAIAVMAAAYILFSRRKDRQKMLAGQIVRYSENYLRACINDALYDSVMGELMEHSVGAVILESVVNTDDTTQIRARVYISETYLPEKNRPHTKRLKKTLTLRRARYPERRRSDGRLFTEKECPSCGANFVPDERGCCSFCGYRLGGGSAKWKMI